MFTIRQLYAMLSMGYVLLMIISMVVIRGLWFYPVEKERALQVQQSEVNGLLSALHLRSEQLEATTHDYASWDDTYNYTLTSGAEFIDDNFQSSTFEALHLNGTLIVGNDNQILYSSYFDDQGLKLSPPLFIQWAETAGDEFFFNKVRSGFQVIDNKVYLIASSPVTPTGEESPVGGWLLFLQKLDNDYIQVLATVARLKMSLVPPPYKSGAANLNQPITSLAAGREGCLFDELGRPSLCLHIDHSNGAGPQMFSTQLILAFLLMSLVPTLVFIGLMRVMIDPIRKATLLLERSNFDQTLRPVLFSTPVRIKELHQLRNAYNELIHTIRQQQARLEQLSNTDRLTNIPNRRAFDEKLEITWRRIQRHPQSIALVLVDIDYFKRFNDHYGHQAGDAALHRVAQALSSCARRADEIAARFGGEEFALILQVEDAQHLEALRRHLRESIRILNIHHEHSSVSKHLTISYGFAWIRDSGPWLEKLGKEEWLRAADSALYEAKASGRDCSMLQVLAPDIPLTESQILKRLPE